MIKHIINVSGENLSKGHLVTTDEVVELTFGSLIRSLRKARGITQYKLAEMVNISAGHMCDIEIGRRSPSSTLSFRLSEALDLNPYLMMALIRKTPENWTDFFSGKDVNTRMFPKLVSELAQLNPTEAEWARIIQFTKELRGDNSPA